jgi:AcrR family transcriptional regulator
LAPGRDTTAPAPAGDRRPARRRNAAQTRQALLDAASARFARDGYAHTTVRDIADEAGVNVALISRYFTSKEGLFEACLTAAVTDLRRDTEATTLDAIAPAMAHRIAGSTADGPPPDALLLLLRSSGDARADTIRRDFLHAISERLAATSGTAADAPARVLRAQIVLATALGMTLLRSTVGVEPLAAATEQDLHEPLSDLVHALLGAGTPGRRG